MNKFDKNILKMFSYYDRDYSKANNNQQENENSKNSISDEKIKIRKLFFEIKNEKNKFIKKTEHTNENNSEVFCLKKDKNINEGSSLENLPSLLKKKENDLNWPFSPCNIKSEDNVNLNYSNQNYIFQIVQILNENNFFFNSLSNVSITYDNLPETINTITAFFDARSSLLGDRFSHLKTNYYEGLNYLENMVSNVKMLIYLFQTKIIQELNDNEIRNQLRILAYSQHFNKNLRSVYFNNNEQ
jgi:hypothetical protein